MLGPDLRYLGLALAGLLFLSLSLFLSGCQTREEVLTSPTPQEAVGLIVEAAPLPTLAPTFTPATGQDQQNQTEQIEAAGQISAAGTATPRPSPSPSVDLTQPVLIYRLTIPDIEFDRSLEGTVAGLITLIDHTTSEEITLRNQNRRLIEIQTVLQSLDVGPIPPDCSGCTAFSFELPIEGVNQSGHLTDSILLASIQHLFTISLGPHFPPSTIAGHHRAASGLTAEHTASLLDDGTLWGWFATDSRLPEPLAAGETAVESFTAQTVTSFEAEYMADCANFPVETIVYGSALFQTKCPDLALPTGLVIPYQQISLLSDPLLEDARNLEIPQTLFPLNARIYFEREDGASIILYEDGTVISRFPSLSSSEPITSTVPPRELDPLIGPMVQSGVIPRGVQVSILPPPLEGEAADFEEFILIRDDLGVYEFAWSDQAGQTLVPGIAVVDLLLSDKVGVVESTSSSEEKPAGQLDPVEPTLEPATPTPEAEGGE